MEPDRAENPRLEMPPTNGEEPLRAVPPERDFPLTVEQVAAELVAAIRGHLENERLLLTLEEAAVALGVSTRTLKRADQEGSLPPGAVVRPFGRSRLFNRLVLAAWCRAGCPRHGNGK
jgi:excisionase family DNA binding protein